MISESALARERFQARSISYLPAFAATELRIPEDTFVLTSHELDSEFIIRSVTDDTACVIAVSIEGALKTLISFALLRRLICVLGQVVTRLECQTYSELAVKAVGMFTYANTTRPGHAALSEPPVSHSYFA